MKKMGLVICTMLLGIGVGYGQNTKMVSKVESPFRLFQGVVLKSDLRMSATVLSELKTRNITDIALNHDDTTKGQTHSERSVAIFSRNQLTPNQNNIVQPAIVLDGFLIDNNSPRFNLGQSPFSKVPWRIPF